MTRTRRRRISTSRLTGSLLFHLSQVDDLGHAGKVARTVGGDELEPMIELLEHRTGSNSARRALAVLGRLG